MHTKNLFTLFAIMLTTVAFAQPTHTFTDDERDYKTAKEFIAKEQYAFAYPLVKESKIKIPCQQKNRPCLY